MALNCRGGELMSRQLLGVKTAARVAASRGSY